MFHAVGVFAIDPPGKIQEQFLKDTLEETVSPTPRCSFDLVTRQRPRQYGDSHHNAHRTFRNCS